LPRKTDLGRVTVVGLGQTGGSVALRLSRSRAAVVTGYDIDSDVVRRARSRRICHHYTTRLTRALAGADITILAVPVASIIASFVDEKIPFDAQSLVMDVGSTKRLIVAAADRRRPPLRFIGGHPLAGNERIGLDGVEYDLFEGASFPLCPGRHASRRDLATARRLVRHLGARPLLVDPDLHDRATGLTIGLPHAIAFLLRDVYEREIDRNRLTEALAGNSIWSTMRVSLSDPTMVGDLIQTNRDWVDYWWRKFAGVGGRARQPARRTGRTNRTKSRRTHA
jgi:prephenate dehydrogenase